MQKKSSRAAGKVGLAHKKDAFRHELSGSQAQKNRHCKISGYGEKNHVI